MLVMLNRIMYESLFRYLKFCFHDIDPSNNNLRVESFIHIIVFFVNNTTITILTYLPIVCFNLGGMISFSGDTSVP